MPEEAAHPGFAHVTQQTEENARVIPECKEDMSRASPRTVSQRTALIARTRGTNGKVIRYPITMANQKRNAGLSAARRLRRRLFGSADPQSIILVIFWHAAAKRSRNLHTDPAVARKRIERKRDANDTGVYIDTIGEDQPVLRKESKIPGKVWNKINLCKSSP